jgi:sugar lactone lactonase YvrE
MLGGSVSSSASIAQAAGKVSPSRHPALVEWAGFAGNAQHTAVAVARPQPFTRIRWKAKVDLHPFLEGGTLPIHYGSPMITAANTVLVPTRVSAKAGFGVVAYAGTNGARRWSLNTDWRPARLASTPHTDTAPLPAVLMPNTTLAVAGAGGTILLRTDANHASASVRRLVFYGAAQWKAHKSEYDHAVRVSTPLTAGPDGSIYFGFNVHGAIPDHLTSGLVRIGPDGHATWISASKAAGSRAVTKVAFNCAPALSPNGKIVYIAVTSPTRGTLIGLGAATLKPRYHVVLRDPTTGKPAVVISATTASPTVGPDGDVYYGVQENPQPRHDLRGWLLHFNATLTKTKIPGSFGWDNTVSVLPAKAVPGYHGKSPYLLVSKYNNYFGVGPHGDGRNKVALLDPRVSQKDPYSSAKVMKAVETVLSPVPDPEFAHGARYEWCINSAVVDPADDSVIVNSEAGIVYRWDLTTGKLVEKMRLNAPRPEAYTPTIIGPDGTVYAINNATLYAIGR